VMLANPAHRLPQRSGCRSKRSVARRSSRHNDPSPGRERVLRVYERRHASINIQIRACRAWTASTRAVEWDSGSPCCRGVARSPKSHAASRAVKVPELELARSVRFVFSAIRRVCLARQQRFWNWPGR
jgi:hypothetical protein